MSHKKFFYNSFAQLSHLSILQSKLEREGQILSIDHTLQPLYNSCYQHSFAVMIYPVSILYHQYLDCNCFQTIVYIKSFIFSFGGGGNEGIFVGQESAVTINRQLLSLSTNDMARFEDEGKKTTHYLLRLLLCTVKTPII